MAVQDYWGGVVEAFPRANGHLGLRGYSDAVNVRLLEGWLPRHVEGRLLKTDLFDEAVGAGLAPALERRAGAVLAIDMSATVVQAALRRYPGLDGRRADVRRLPFEDGAFAAVLSNSTLDHFDSLAETGMALAELRRVLAPRGRLLVTLDNRANPLVALRNALPYGALSRLGLVPYPPGATAGPRGLRRLLCEAGFEVERLGAVMHVPRVLMRALAPLGEERVLRPLVACEGLGRLPTRYLTGQFVAALARRR
jgi:SAM-dependent methyltransferase